MMTFRVFVTTGHPIDAARGATEQICLDFDTFSEASIFAEHMIENGLNIFLGAWDEKE